MIINREEMCYIVTRLMYLQQGFELACAPVHSPIVSGYSSPIVSEYMSGLEHRFE